MSPTDLSLAQVFFIHKVLEVVVVCEHKYFMLPSFLVVLPSFESFNNGQKLSIVGFVTDVI